MSGQASSQPYVETRVLDTVREYWETANIREASIIERTRNFFGGTLYRVEITDAKGEPHENFVYAAGDDVRRFDNFEQLFQEFRRPPTLGESLARLTAVNSVAAIIAILFSVAVCLLILFRSTTEVPSQMWSAITLILGFYFGAAAQKAI